MSIKSTRTITRTHALEILDAETHHLPNSALADMLDTLADSGMAVSISAFDNFEVESD